MIPADSLTGLRLWPLLVLHLRSGLMRLGRVGSCLCEEWWSPVTRFKHGNTEGSVFILFRQLLGTLWPKCTILDSRYVFSWPLYPFRSLSQLHVAEGMVHPYISLQLSRAPCEHLGDSLPCSRVGWWCSDGVLATLLYSQNSCAVFFPQLGLNWEPSASVSWFLLCFVLHLLVL